jgi:hypothetical protein
MRELSAHLKQPLTVSAHATVLRSCYMCTIDSSSSGSGRLLYGVISPHTHQSQPQLSNTVTRQHQPGIAPLCFDVENYSFCGMMLLYSVLRNVLLMCTHLIARRCSSTTTGSFSRSRLFPFFKIAYPSSSYFPPTALTLFTYQC